MTKLLEKCAPFNINAFRNYDSLITGISDSVMISGSHC